MAGTDWLVLLTPTNFEVSLREQTVNEAWYTSLSLLADEALPLFWRLSYGASFWWTPARAELLPNGFATQPFTYEEVASVTLFDTVHFGVESVTCDLTLIAHQLSGVAGLLLTKLNNVTCPPVKPTNQALQLTVR